MRTELQCCTWRLVVPIGEISAARPRMLGRLIGTFTTATVDAHGMALASAKLPGGHWRIRHDVKHAILFAVRGMGILVNCEDRP